MTSPSRFNARALPALLLGAIAIAGACSASSKGGTLDGDGPGGASGVGPSANASGGPSNGTGFATSSGSGGSGGGGDPTTCAGAASAHTYIGCDYWPTVTANSIWSVFDYAVIVANAGTQQADVTVTRGGAPVAQASVAPNALTKIYLPWVSDLKGPDWNTCTDPIPFAATARSKAGAYHLVSTIPVTVYQFNALEYAGQGGPAGKDWGSCPGNQYCPEFDQAAGCFSYSNDASLLLPSTAMTGNYRVIAGPGFADPSGGGFVAVTGTQDGTTVTVTTSGTAKILGGGGVATTGPGGKATFSLDAGDVVELAGAPSADFGGTLVQSDKPVQVLSGHPCTALPDTGDNTCDHIEETVFPAETLGKHYVITAPTGPHGSPVADLVRLFGNVDNTALSYPSGAPPSAPGTINAGQIVDLPNVNVDFEIQGDHEFGVATLMSSAQIVDPNGGDQPKGDPSLSQATAVEQFRTKYIFLAPSDYDVNYVDVVQPLAAAITIDGQPASAGPTPIGQTFGVTRIQLGAGNGGAHVLTSTMPVGIQVLGYGSYTSYQYAGGSNFEAIAPPPPPPN